MCCQTRPMASSPAARERPPIVLSDGVVVLRPPRVEDAADIALGCQDPDIVRWTTVPAPYARADAEEFIALRSPDGPAGAAGWWECPTWAITIGDDRWAGTIDLRLADPECAEVGYLVAPWARGRGVATRSLRLACRWGFSALGLRVIQWRAQVGNEASRAVAARLGFRISPQVHRLALASRGERHDGWFGDLLVDDLPDAGGTRRRARPLPRLTRREQDVLDLMAAGRSNRHIAERLGISENTVKNHVRRILEKLQAASRVEAVVSGVQQGLTRLP